LCRYIEPEEDVSVNVWLIVGWDRQTGTAAAADKATSVIWLRLVAAFLQADSAC